MKIDHKRAYKFGMELIYMLRNVNMATMRKLMLYGEK